MGDAYERVWESEWVSPKHRRYRMQCCDCGLVHDFDFRIVDDHVEYRVRVNKRSTSQVRRHMKAKR